MARAVIVDRLVGKNPVEDSACDLDMRRYGMCSGISIVVTILGRTRLKGIVAVRGSP